MRPMHVAEDIVPLSQFKTHASQILERMKKSNGAIVITQNGRPAAVVMTPAEFDRLREEERFREAVQQGLEDERAGRLIPHKEVRRRLEHRPLSAKSLPPGE